jgi:hypothetical protein
VPDRPPSGRSRRRSRLRPPRPPGPGFPPALAPAWRCRHAPAPCPPDSLSP